MSKFCINELSMYSLDIEARETKEHLQCDPKNLEIMLTLTMIVKKQTPAKL